MNLKREQSISYVQDILHLGNKVQNRIQKFSIMLPMGVKQVSVSHLKMLLTDAPKELHGLTASDINPYDRQNYAAFEKITGNRVLKALEKYVADSEATIMYLKLAGSIVRSYNDVKLSPLERVYCIFHPLYFFRAWKKWIVGQVDDDGSTLYDVEANFITHNAFDCLELNAYNLLHLITKFRDAKEPQLFLPGLFNSQGCEHTFRHFRSMSTANWTKINFTFYELIHMIGRMELKSEIENSKLLDIINFPRLHKPEKHTVFDLPADEEIKKVLDKAYKDALFDAAEVGMTVSENDNIRSCELVRRNIQYQQPSQQQPNELIVADDDIDYIIDCTHFHEYSIEVSKQPSAINENSPFVNVMDEDGLQNTIKKSAIVWLLSESRGNLSSDRLKRVQARKEDESNGPKRIYIPPTISTKRKIGDLFELSEIKVGEWCIFFNGEPKYQNLIVGNILCFKYLTGDTEKQRQYSLDIAPIKTNSKNPRGLLVLGLWHSLNADFTLQLIARPSFFVNINNYVASINTPEIDSNKTKKIIGNLDEMKISLSILLSK